MLGYTVGAYTRRASDETTQNNKKVSMRYTLLTNSFDRGRPQNTISRTTPFIIRPRRLIDSCWCARGRAAIGRAPGTCSGGRGQPREVWRRVRRGTRMGFAPSGLTPDRHSCYSVDALVMSDVGLARLSLLSRTSAVYRLVVRAKMLPAMNVWCLTCVDIYRLTVAGKRKCLDSGYLVTEIFCSP